MPGKIFINLLIICALILVSCGEERNTTGEALNGEWHLMSYECCELQQEEYNRDEIVWLFNTSDQKVTITNNIAFDDFTLYNFKESGLYTIQLIENEKKITIMYNKREKDFEYGISKDSLLLSHSPESDGPMLIFVR